jgi:hypothetical protein
MAYSTVKDASTARACSYPVPIQRHTYPQFLNRTCPLQYGRHAGGCQTMIGDPRDDLARHRRSFAPSGCADPLLGSRCVPGALG